MATDTPRRRRPPGGRDPAGARRAAVLRDARGSGPVVLLICGGIYDAAALSGLADLLADRHTVLTYDRRGNSRSPLTGPTGPQPVEAHVDDAHRLLAAVAGDQPAYVFGNSSGAQIGLGLAAAHPEQVRVLVAHEPPLLHLLPDAAHWEQVLQQVAAAYGEGGAGPAMGVFAAAMGMSGGDDGSDGSGADGGAAPPEVAEMLARFEANLDTFIGSEVPVSGRQRPDLDALRAGASRIVLAAGTASAGEPPHRAALAVAGRLGSQPVLLPGDHGGFGPHAAQYAAELRALFVAS